MQNEFGQSQELELTARQLQPGTWVRIAWLDGETTVALFLRYRGGSRSGGNHRQDFKGDRSIECFYPNGCGHLPMLHEHAVHKQVIEVLEVLKAPK